MIAKQELGIAIGSRKMRIVQVAPFYYPVVGGAEEVVTKISEHFVSKGHDVFVVTYNRLRLGEVSGLSKSETINGVNVIRLKPNAVWSHGTFSSELPNTLHQLKPDVVHVHGWRHPHVFQVAKAKKQNSFKTFLHGHGPFHSLSQSGLAVWLYYKAIDGLMKATLKKYDSIVALTEHERKILIAKLDVSIDKTVIIPNGIDDIYEREGAIPTGYTGNTLLYLGAMNRAKNVRLAVDSMKFVVRQISNAKLVLAGQDQGVLKKLLRYHDGHLEYRGLVSNIEKVELYRSCKIFIHPAIYEPFGITLLEAQAFGKPCIITGDGGQLYAAPPMVTSLLAKPEARDFAEKIKLLLDNNKMYEYLSRNAREWAIRHLWSKILPKYESLYVSQVS